MSGVQIRELRAEDAPAVAELSGQLGYAVTPQEARSRIEEVLSSPERIAFGAERNRELVGWIEGAVERHLLVSDLVNVAGLIIRDNARGCGIGKLLCIAMEDWARRRGVATVRVRSNILRKDAHRFYRRDGYRLVKTSLVFEKSVLPA